MPSERVAAALDAYARDVAEQSRAHLDDVRRRLLLDQLAEFLAERQLAGLIALVRVPGMAVIAYRLQLAAERRARAYRSWRAEERLALAVLRPASLIAGGSL